MKINPILLTAVGLSCISLFSWITINNEQYLSTQKVLRISNEGQYIPIREAIVIACMWLMSKEKANTKEPEQPPEPPHRELYQHPDPQPPLHDTADTLIDVGLAHIGRITARTNLYITPEQTQSRHNAERPFTKLLAERYTDTNTRKALARHFMLYKEVTLFVIFAMVLKNDKQLLTKIQSRLKVRLSLGLPSKAIASRNEYWRKLSDKFNESYTRTKDLAITLEYVFWSVLPEKLKGDGFADLTNNGYLMQIFDYTREALTKEYNNLKQKQTI